MKQLPIFPTFPFSRYVLACLLLTLAATSASADIRIDAPTEPVAAGQNVQIFVAGIATDDLPRAIARHWPREQTTFVAAKTWGNQPFIWFAARLPGKYLIEITVPRLVDGEATLEHAEAVVVVGDGGPQPNPPIPPVPPVPGEISIVVIVESATRTATEAAMLGALRAHFRLAGESYFWRIVDRDTIDGATEKTPGWLLPYLTALNKTPTKVPALVVLARTPNSSNTSTDPPSSRASSVVVAVESLVGLSGVDAVALVKKYGGR